MPTSGFQDVYWNTFTYDHWRLHLAATATGLCCVSLQSESFELLSQWIKRHIPEARIIESVEKVGEYQQQLCEYLAGERKDFTFGLDMRGTPFQVEVWQALTRIPYGQTSSYSEMAERLKRPKAIRAVGAANGANPLPIVVPCHRMLGKHGDLTGFRGGIELKAELLRLEGARVEAVAI